MSYLRRSKWAYNTGANLTASIGPFVASGGMLILDDPEKRSQQFRFGSFGMGVGIVRLPQSLRLPELALPRGYGVSPSGATADFWGEGVIFMNRSFHGSELTVHDFNGGALIADVSGGLLIAKGYTLMHVGIPPGVLASAIYSPVFAHLAVNSARAIVAMKGINEGLVDGIGASASIGTLSYKGSYSGD